MKKIKVGIIGQGRSGYGIHTSSLRLMPDQYAVAAVADPLEGRCDDAVKEWHCDAYSDYKEMLKRDDLDLVVNATPSYLHVPLTLEIMDAGHNVLCEKPFARKVADVDKMIAKSKETGKLLAIYQQSRFAPYFQQVKKVIDSGVLGRIVTVKIAFNGFSRRWDWQTMQDFHGGNLMNTGPHPLDQALQLFGTDIMPKVTCIMDSANSAGDAEDEVKLIMHGEGRPTIDLELSSCCAYPKYTYQVYATNGGLTGNMDHIDWKYFIPSEAGEMTLIPEPMPARSYCTEQLKWYEESWDYPDSQRIGL
ncbi:MAG TPA: Gfo/Idh/MocA family oxidoreductase, partial [Armatimonadota bacterium]